MGHFTTIFADNDKTDNVVFNLLRQNAVDFQNRMLCRLRHKWYKERPHALLAVKGLTILLVYQEKAQIGVRINTTQLAKY